MTSAVTHKEPMEFGRLPAERCVVCRTGTRRWLTPDTPVHERCIHKLLEDDMAKGHKLYDLMHGKIRPKQQELREQVATFKDTTAFLMENPVPWAIEPGADDRRRELQAQAQKINRIAEDLDNLFKMYENIQKYGDD